MSTNTHDKKKSSEVRGISFPVDLKRQIDAEARKGYRSFSQEVLFLVQRGLQDLAKEGGDGQ